jgi:uncharacterized protein
MSDTRLHSLIKELKKRDNAVIAFSGGVDSTLLVRTAAMVDIRFLAVTSSSETTPLHDLENAKRIALDFKIVHRIIKTRELNDRTFSSNSPDRCFFCKDMLFTDLRKLATAEGYEHILDGSNADDEHDFRPGLRANRKHGVISPLKDAGLSKRDVRELSRELGLSTWDAPSSPCLSSRFPYGERITLQGIQMVSRAEEYLRSLGFRIVRVRTAGGNASVEVGVDEIDRLRDHELRDRVTGELKKIGYQSVHFDDEGYRSGKLNRSIQI